MRITFTLCLLIFPLLAAAEPDGYFSHNDWEILCDNTRTCRAAGYSLNGEDSRREMLSVLLTREAGPSTPVSTEVTIVKLDSGDRDIDNLHLTIGLQDLGKVEKQRLTSTQTSALLAALRDKDSVVFSHHERRITLSTQGAKAVLLKMDDIQGRIGTPGALIRKGIRDESQVLPPLPVPVIFPATPSKEDWQALSLSDNATLRPTLIASLGDDRYCDYLMESRREADYPLLATKLDNRHLLVRILCWRGAYSEGYGYWVIDPALKTVPRLVTDSGTHYSEGKITLSHQGRDTGNCQTNAQWVWDGNVFQQGNASVKGMCHGVPGGLWTLQSHVAQVKVP